MKVEETWVLVKMRLMQDKELCKRDWEIEGLVNFIGKHELCRLQGLALISYNYFRFCVTSGWL
jgi:hypothetical protein